MVLSEKLDKLVEHVSNFRTEIRNRIDKIDARLDALETKISKIEEKKSKRAAFGKQASDIGEILDGTVKEVRTRIKGLKSPDFGVLLDAERDGRNRKTVKEWLRKQITGSRARGSQKN